MSPLTLSVAAEQDVVLTRRTAREVAELLGFDVQDQTRIATAASEIVRNAQRYAGGGRVHFAVVGTPPRQELRIRVEDEGPGIADLPAVLDGRYSSPTGMGMGIIGTRRLMDHFAIDSEPGRGTRVELGKRLPRAHPAPEAVLARIGDAFARQQPRVLLEEFQRQNRDLLHTLDELRARQQELQRLNRELEDTNRGVVALYAELEDRAEQLRRANHVKAQFLSYMSHEFRSPLDSVLAISGLLLNRVDGELTAEQELQVGFMRQAAADLLRLVDDLLDMARVEAGQVSIRPTTFTVHELFNSLRALMRPLVPPNGPQLHFEVQGAVEPLHTDEARVAQILRNLISNALKFTETGTVTVSAAAPGLGETVTFQVADQGIGIAADDQERIFQDFGQIDGPLQRRVRGTGLGLPLSQKLAELLGGRISLQSELGRGSTFSVAIPRLYPGETAQPGPWIAD